MVTRQTWAGWAAVLATAVLAAPGYSAKPEASQGAADPAAKKDVSTAPSGSQAELAKELILDLGGGITMKLALIPAGKFMMGEGKNQHEVTLSKPFFMGVTEVTQSQYKAVMGECSDLFKGETNPANASWNQAAEFCKKLSAKTRQPVRLPTEAEWEYACRAGSKTKFCFGDADEGLGDYAWFGANGGNTTHPVGQKKPNAWGLYDMHGNVDEWCSDWYGEVADGQAADPTGPEKGSGRVSRGGVYDTSARFCRSAFRGHSPPESFTTGSGLRVVVSVGGTEGTPSKQPAKEPGAAVGNREGPLPKQPANEPATAERVEAGVRPGEARTFAGLEFVWIPPGRFTMGSKWTPEEIAAKYGGKADWLRGERPQHQVTLSRGFWMGVHEVTNREFEAFVKATGYKTDAEKEGHGQPYLYAEKPTPGLSWNHLQVGPTEPNLPVVLVSWHDAQAYINWLNSQGQGRFRLPTEAEWEYACRAGTQTEFPWGDDPAGGKGWCNVADQAGKKEWGTAPVVPADYPFFGFDDGYAYLAPVGSFRANAWGLKDMIGNANEWCQDWGAHDYYSQGPATDPPGPDKGPERVVRGGCIGDIAFQCRSTRRQCAKPELRSMDLGFRVVREPTAGQPLLPKLSVMYYDARGETQRADVEVRLPFFMSSTLSMPDKVPFPAAVSRDGTKYLITTPASNSGILLDTVSGRTVKLEAEFFGPLTDGNVAFTPDNKRLLKALFFYADQHETVLAASDADTGRALGMFDRYRGSATSLPRICVNADGTLAATGDGLLVRLYGLDGASIKFLKEIEIRSMHKKGWAGHFQQILFSPDSRYLFASHYLADEGSSLRRLDLKATVPTLERVLGSVAGVAFNPVEPMAVVPARVVDRDGWEFVDMLKGNVKKRVKTPSVRNQALAVYDPRGRCYELVMTDFEVDGSKVPVLWDLDKGLPWVALRDCTGHAIRFTTDGCVTAWATKDRIGKWKLP